MAFGLEKAFNKFAEVGTSLNRGANQIIGKEVFKDIRQVESPRDFPPYSSFQAYSIPEPEQWFPITGISKKFTLEGNIISVSANLDACMQYRNIFKSSAEYYMEQFKFKYQNCVQDFDTLIHYFQDIYFESLRPMIKRAYDLLLPFGIFTADIESFTSRHIDTYNIAITSYGIMADMETAKAQAAANTGNQVGGALQMQGGGFGFKGAMKGAAKAEAFNLGMGLLGKFVENQSKMTQEEKANAFAAFRHDLFFQEVYSDYFNTFFTMVQTLSENGKLEGITTTVSTEIDTMIRNLQNPMFPQDKVVFALVKIISSNPFVPACFDLLQQKFGQTEEVNQIVSYFVG